MWDVRQYLEAMCIIDMIAHVKWSVEGREGI